MPGSVTTRFYQAGECITVLVIRRAIDRYTFPRCALKPSAARVNPASLMEEIPEMVDGVPIYLDVSVPVDQVELLM